MTALTTQRASGRPEPDGAPDVAVPHAPRPADPPTAASGGVELRRLTALVRLTAPQALEIGAGVLAEAARWRPDAGGPEGGATGVDRILVGADGAVVLGSAADGGPDPTRSDPAGAAVAAALADLSAAARLGVRDPDPATGRLLAELDRAGTDLPVAGVAVVARRLQEALAGIDRPAVRAELAALVNAVRGATGAAGGGPAGGPSTVDPGAPARREAAGAARSVWRRVGAWLLSLVVLASVVAVEVAVLRDEIATDIGLLLDAGRGESTSSAAPARDGLPVPVPAPAAAGSVTAVELRPLTRCLPDARCRMRVQVQLVPGAERRAVSWSYRVVDRCTGATGTSPGGSIAVPADGRRAAAVSTVSLPAARALAVVAVTETPAVAASTPLLVGSCLPERQAG